MGVCFAINAGTLILLLNFATCLCIRNISVLYDDKVQSSHLNWLLPFLTSTSGSCRPGIDTMSLRNTSLLDILQILRRDHVIIVIECVHCRSSAFAEADNVTLLCVKDNGHYTMTTCRSELLASRAWATLISCLSMPKVVIFYDHLTATSLSDVERSISSTHTFVWNGEDFMENFLFNTKYRNFIISTYPQQTFEIVTKSRELRLFGPEFNWLVDMRSARKDVLTKLSRFIQDGDNTVIVILAESYRTLQTLEVLESVGKIASCQQPDVNKKEDKPFPVLDLYKCVKNCRRLSQMTHIATVSSDGFITNRKNIFPKKFGGFKKRLLRVVTKVYEPFVILERGVNGSPVYTGVCIEILDALAETLDFRYELFEVEDGKFGVTNESGMWNGIIGTIARGEADIAATGLTVSLDRDQVVDYTFPFWEEPSTVLLKKPKGESKLGSVFQPFKPSTWYGVIGSVFATSAIIHAMCRMSTRLLRLDEPLSSLTDCLWYTFGALLGQGTEKQPVSLSCRAVASCWWIVVIVLYAVYTGNLIAFLTVTIPNMPFNTLEGMVQQTDYKYGLEDGIIHMMLFREAESGVYKDIWKGIQKNHDSVVVKTSDIGLRKVQTENYAFIGEKTFLQARSVNNCDLVMIKEEFFKSSFAFAVAEDWPYKKYFDEAIMSMVEAGFIDYWRRVHSKGSKCGANTAAVTLRPTHLEDTSGLYIVLLSGGLLATLSLIIEVLASKATKGSSSKTEKNSHLENPKNTFTSDPLSTRPNVGRGHTSATGLHQVLPSTAIIENGNLISNDLIPKYLGRNGEACMTCDDLRVAVL